MSDYIDLQKQRNRVEMLQLRIVERDLREKLGADDDHNTLVAIQTIIDELDESSMHSKDVMAIKSMKRIENVMKLWDQESDDTPIDEPEKVTNQTLMSKYRVNIDFVTPSGSIEDERAVFLELP